MQDLGAIPRVCRGSLTERKTLVELYGDQARNKHPAVVLTDHSIKEPVEGEWKGNAERLIRESSMTIRLVGENSWRFIEMQGK